jgi:hypothetical protein
MRVRERILHRQAHRASAAIERDRRFALTRCWSGGDSNCRSHPTKSLVSGRVEADLFASTGSLSGFIAPRDSGSFQRLNNR